MTSGLRKALHRYVPRTFHDPLGLAVRLLRTENPAARAAMGYAALGLALAPFDLCLAPFERRRLAKAGIPQRPIVLVCGPPRSGTTLLTQTLISALPFGYFTNLSVLFPRAPLTASALFHGIVEQRKVSAQSYYGRTRYLSGPNDALPIWDRWLGKNREKAPTEIAAPEREAMARFFAAFESQSGHSIIAKNNSLNASAHLVAEALPTARFICLRREPLFLAQSLLEARRAIHGSEVHPYGPTVPGAASEDADPLESVARQVRFHESLAQAQLDRLGAERFRIVSYESLCRAPSEVVGMVARDILGISVDVAQPIAPIPASNKLRLPPEQVSRLETIFARGTAS